MKNGDRALLFNPKAGLVPYEEAGLFNEKKKIFFFKVITHFR